MNGAWKPKGCFGKIVRFELGNKNYWLEIPQKSRRQVSRTGGKKNKKHIQETAQRPVRCAL